MLDRLPLADTLALLHADLGAPPLVALDPRDGPTALRTALASLLRSGDGGLLALLARTPAEAALVLSWLRAAKGVDAQAVPVVEGELVVVFVPAREAVTAPPPSPAPRATPDLVPVLGATADDLDERLLRRVLAQAGPTPDHVLPEPATAEERMLARHGLLAHDGTRWRPTVAAVVALAHRPDVFVPGCAVHGTVDGEPIEARGPLPRLLRTMDRALDAPLLRAVVLEGVLNAMLHRDWRDRDSPVQLTVVGERVEIVHPGRLADGAPDRPRHRNPKLVELAVDLGLTHGTGRSLADVGASVVDARRSPPTLTARDGVVRFVAEVPLQRAQVAARPTLPAPRNLPPVPAARPQVPSVAAAPTTEEAACLPPAAAPTMVTPPAAPVATSPLAVPSLLPRDPDDRSAAVLAALHARQRATTRELAAALGCSRPVIGKVITALVAEGRVRPTVAEGHSPFQAYEVA